MGNHDNSFQKELQDKELYFLSEFFKALGTPTRLRILFLLMEGEACVSELADKLQISQSSVSHQLNLLKSNKLVRKRRKGKLIFYALVDDHVRLAVQTKRAYFGGVRL